MIRLTRPFFSFFLTAMFLAGVSSAQESRGKILGRVLDATGAAVPGASITGINEEMNTRVLATSNEAGNYELPFLLPGTYRIEVVAQGFKQHTRRPIEVQVGDVITVDVALEVGQLSREESTSSPRPRCSSPPPPPCRPPSTTASWPTFPWAAATSCS